MLIFRRLLQFSFCLIFLFFTHLLFKIDPFLSFIYFLPVFFLTFILGRVFCGYICPLGSLIDLIDFILTPLRKLKIEFHLKFFHFKFFILILVIFGIIFKIPFLSFFDPFVIFSSLTQFDFRLSNIRVEYIIIFVIFSLLKNRFWCRYICPLGGLLSIISKFSILTRIVEKCNFCLLCIKNCSTGAIDKINPALYKKEECIVCYKCIKNCPIKHTFFKFIQLKKLELDFSKREFLTSSIGIFISLFLSKYLVSIHKFIKPGIRPPGSVNEKKFINSCIRCGLCIKVCPTGALHRLKIDSGILNYGTPILIPEKGYCKYYCKKCLAICPTGAIENLQLKQKQKFVMGKAKINRELCFVYSRKAICLLCEAHCPLPDKAIKLKRIGNLKFPYVAFDLCIGCGACEYVCPSSPKAITVSPLV